ncbi:MAG: carbohydrate ABC transporter permease [Firmicutes bacterium]|nr:carbohydrate ABC transporter permease [Bacillota bacterium]
MKSGITVREVATFIILLILALAAIIPLYWMVVTAIQRPTLTMQFPPEWIPSEPTLDNFRRFFQRPYVWNWTINSVIIAVTVTTLQIFASALAGYTFAKKKFIGSQVLFWLYVGSMMVPNQVTLVPLYLLMSKLGFLDSFKGLILPGLAGPFGVFLMKQYISTLPSELIDAAKIDGCSEWGIFQKVILPLSKPGLAVLAIFTFVGQWNAFTWPLIVTSSSAMRTLPVGLALLQEEVPMQFALLMAGATYAAIPMLIVFLAFQRYFLEGVTVGALKG